MRKIYLDYASLTPIDKRVKKIMKKYEKKEYGNPSALYASGVAAKKVLQESREKVAKIINAHPDEIIFTSGGTESNEIALRTTGTGHIVISEIEHSSIIKNTKATQIRVDKSGIVDLEELKKAITPETAFVSVMMVNNETGTIEPIREIAKIVRDAGKSFNSNILFHTDASQAMYLPLHVEKLGVDLMTLDGNKIYGPRGVGMLYVKRGTAEIHRSGTENLPGIAGIACALEIAEKTREKEYARISELKNFFAEELKKKNVEIKVNGSIKNSSPHILSVSIPNIDNEFFVLQLDAKGIECSTKSACLKDEDESYVLKAMGADSRISVRFSFGRHTTKRELKKVIKTLTM
ncbi:MAG: cysteine desulfurase family protein [bacterium]|nr:cysteine desulfurase family protein [bacterium]